MKSKEGAQIIKEVGEYCLYSIHFRCNGETVTFIKSMCYIKPTNTTLHTIIIILSQLIAFLSTCVIWFVR